MNDEFIIRIKKQTHIELQDVKAGSSKVVASHPPAQPIYELVGELKFRNKDERDRVHKAILSAME